MMAWAARKGKSPIEDVSEMCSKLGIAINSGPRRTTASLPSSLEATSTLLGGRLPKFDVHDSDHNIALGDSP